MNKEKSYQIFCRQYNGVCPIYTNTAMSKQNTTLKNTWKISKRNLYFLHQSTDNEYSYSKYVGKLVSRYTSNTNK